MVVHACNLSCWETELRRLIVQGKSRHKVHEILSQVGMVTPACHPGYVGSINRRVKV
jgi:hypothetical protein